MLQRHSTIHLTLAAAALVLAGASHAQTAPAKAEPIKVGLMLPYTGTYANLGNMIENGFKLFVQEQGGKLAGREVQYFKVDDESEPSKATDNVNKLLKRDQVDVVIGSVHSGVALAMARAAKESNKLLIVPNAGADAITGPICSKTVFRSSFSNWQPAYAMGQLAAKKGYKKAITVTWNYAAGNESVKGFAEGFEKGGGKIMQSMNIAFPNVEFQALLTQIASQKPDVVYSFFAGGGAVKFVKDYAATGMNKTIPLVGPGFLTDGTLEAQGAAAQGMITTLHYADNLNIARDKAFRLNFAKTYKTNADVYAVQGYDAAQMLTAGLRAANGDIRKLDQVVAGIEKAEIDSPRGKFKLSAAHNPVHDIYIRQVKGNLNEFQGVAMKQLADPGRGCKM